MANNIADIEKIPKKELCDFGHDKFVKIYEQKFHQPGEPFFQEQKAFFLEELMHGSYAARLQLPSTTSFSVFNAFMSLAINGLSLEKNFTTQCYLECKSTKIGKNDKGVDIYGNIARITITGYGEVFMRVRAGQIRGIDNPVVVYNSDDFKFGERDGHKFVEWCKCDPRPQGDKLKGCYVKIYKADGSYDYYFMDLTEILRLKGYSEKFNGRYGANPLYGRLPDGTDIDTGFLISKTIKHAFKGYPKLPIGGGAVMESDKDTTDAPKPDGNQQQQSFAELPPVDGVKVKTDADNPFNE